MSVLRHSLNLTYTVTIRTHQKHMVLYVDESDDHTEQKKKMK